jgi:hypothetical protein
MRMQRRHFAGLQRTREAPLLALMPGGERVSIEARRSDSFPAFRGFLDHLDDVAARAASSNGSGRSERASE